MFSFYKHHTRLTMTCKNCGSELKDGAKFCGHCGAIINSDESAATKEDDSTKKIEMSNLSNGLQKYKKWGGIAYLIVMIIILNIIVNYITFSFTKIAFSAILINLVSAGIGLAVFGFIYDKIENLFQDNFTKDDIWLFGIEFAKRKKIAKILKIIGKVLFVIADICILFNAVSLYAAYGFSWMLLLAFLHNSLTLLLIGEIFEEASKVFNLD